MTHEPMTNEPMTHDTGPIVFGIDRDAILSVLPAAASAKEAAKDGGTHPGLTAIYLYGPTKAYPSFTLAASDSYRLHAVDLPDAPWDDDFLDVWGEPPDTEDLAPILAFDTQALGSLAKGPAKHGRFVTISWNPGVSLHGHRGDLPPTDLRPTWSGQAFSLFVGPPALRLRSLLPNRKDPGTGLTIVTNRPGESFVDMLKAIKASKVAPFVSFKGSLSDSARPPLRVEWAGLSGVIAPNDSATPWYGLQIRDGGLLEPESTGRRIGLRADWLLDLVGDIQMPGSFNLEMASHRKPVMMSVNQPYGHVRRILMPAMVDWD